MDSTQIRRSFRGSGHRGELDTETRNLENNIGTLVTYQGWDQGVVWRVARLCRRIEPKGPLAINPLLPCPIIRQKHFSMHEHKDARQGRVRGGVNLFWPNEELPTIDDAHITS